MGSPPNAKRGAHWPLVRFDRRIVRNDVPLPSWPEPSSSQAPSWPEPSSSQAPSWPEPSSSQAPSSPEPSSSQAPSSREPSSSQAPSWPEPSSSQAPSSREPSSSQAPSSREPSSSQAPSSREPSSSQAPSWRLPSSWPESSWRPSDHFFFGLSAAFSVELGLNFIAVEAAIFTGAPVCGLRPVRALRLVVLNEPKPGQATFSPFLVASTTWSKNAPRVRSASALETPAASATASISSALVAIESSFDGC